MTSTRSQVKLVVLQYTILTALNLILSHEIGRNAYDSVWEDPALKNFTAVFKSLNATFTPNTNTTSLLSNGTFSVSNNSTTELQKPFESEAFYSRFLPRELFVRALLCPLDYYFYVFLERLCPTRPRGVDVSYQKEKVEINVNEGQEEEIIQRWIAQGKVKRSSISWWNTIVKWVLDMTVGLLYYITLHSVLDQLLRWTSPRKILKGLTSGVLLLYFTQFLTLTPLSSLLAFIVVPVTKRVPFTAGIFLIEGVFMSIVYRTAIPWVIHTEFAQTVLRNTTEGLMLGQIQGKEALKRNGREL